MEHGGWNFLDAEGADDEDGEGEDSEEEGAREPYHVAQMLLLMNNAVQLWI